MWIASWEILMLIKYSADLEKCCTQSYIGICQQKKRILKDQTKINYYFFLLLSLSLSLYIYIYIYV